MKRLSRDFTRGEKVLLLLLELILVGMAYYFVVDRPVRMALESAKAEKEALVTELTALQGRLAKMEKMQAELEALQANPEMSRMGS
jgi:Tfp pilus assembly protein PilO